MLQAIKNKLLTLYQNGKSEFHKSPYQTSAALIVIGGLIFQTITALSEKVEFSNPIVKVLQENMQSNISLIALALGLLVWSFILQRQNTITLDNQKANILVFLAMQNDPITAESIADRLVIHIQTVLLHLNELKELNMVKWSAAYPKGDNWSITQDGRKYLSKKNLLP